MDEASSVQFKIIRLIMLGDNFCTRLGYGADLSPTEALAYKSILDYTRAHVRMMELYTLDAIKKMEDKIYGDENESSGNKPKGRVAGEPGRPPTPKPRMPEEGDELADGFDC